MEYWWIFFILGAMSSIAGGLVLSGIVFRKELGKIREEQREISESRREFREAVQAFEKDHGYKSSPKISGKSSYNSNLKVPESKKS